MPFRNQDAAAERRQQLAAQLLRGEAVAVNQQGAIVPVNDNGTNAAIQIPEGKLATSSLYWYERDPELFEAELGAMQHFFPSSGPIAWRTAAWPGLAR